MFCLHILPGVWMRIELQDAKAGMVLREALCDSGGTVILAAGGELTEWLIGQLEGLGISELEIVDGDEEDEIDLLGVMRTQISEQLDALFQDTDQTDELMHAMRQLAGRFVFDRELEREESSKA